MVEIGRRLTASRARNPAGRGLAAYTEYGGPGQKIYVLIPLQSPHETGEGSGLVIDGWAEEALQTLGAGLKNGEGFIATYVPELSNPPAEPQTEAAPYVHLTSATIKPESGEELKRMAREAGEKIVAAHRRNAKGQRFVTYHSYSGPDDVFHVAVPFDSFGELDGWVGNRELAREEYGADEAAKLLDAVSRVIADSASRVAVRHPFIAGPE
jgi:hypothetical protein